jgi:hydroxypyruvate isomerase
MNSTTRFTRRHVLGMAGAVALSAAARADTKPARANGNIRQSVCRWCYGRVPLEKLAAEAKRIGFKSIELLSAEEILKIKPLGLTCAVMGGADIVRGLNRTEFHEANLSRLRKNIEFAAGNNIPAVIVMSGNRTIAGKTVADDEGMETCVKALKQIVGLAEEKKVTILMEGLNSKVDHKDYMYDRTSWGVALAKKVGSPRFKLLYDIYHMQIMEGDVIRTIQRNKEYIGHYHTGGVPGRHEIDETQELYYPAIIKAILETGYQGFLGQEYIPARDAIPSLEQGFKICDV